MSELSSRSRWFVVMKTRRSSEADTPSGTFRRPLRVTSLRLAPLEEECSVDVLPSLLLLVV
jgi:hypothetical protein